MGIANVWNNDLFAGFDFNDNECWEKLLIKTGGWIVHKIKDWKELAEGEKWGLLYMQEIEGVE